jgi:hypothetical protein
VEREEEEKREAPAEPHGPFVRHSGSWKSLGAPSLQLAPGERVYHAWKKMDATVRDWVGGRWKRGGALCEMGVRGEGRWLDGGYRIREEADSRRGGTEAKQLKMQQTPPTLA